ncbi:hypothetical protein BC938DRAFT_475014 [Jimgerdemannia flammicorona]|uniref:Uncharacterized protein n=1 Tax=Jimgerdemannia flammicorona TaxID=994334 RepID=A0A433Q173_9FUNG|nr:hypothetical protein BC938DRAFT_475014 [Jimgerdemannia flammicorona]
MTVPVLNPRFNVTNHSDPYPAPVETGSVTQSRHALPGSALVFFSIAAVLAWVRFHAGRDR